jgi:hypothetical protein
VEAAGAANAVTMADQELVINDLTAWVDADRL